MSQLPWWTLTVLCAALLFIFFQGVHMQFFLRTKQTFLVQNMSVQSMVGCFLLHLLQLLLGNCSMLHMVLTYSNCDIKSNLVMRKAKLSHGTTRLLRIERCRGAAQKCRSSQVSAGSLFTNNAHLSQDMFRSLNAFDDIIGFLCIFNPQNRCLEQRWTMHKS